MSEAVAIRRGTARDRAFVLDLGRRIAMTSVSSQRLAPPPLVEAAYEQLVAAVLSRDHDILVAEVDGVPAGFALVLYDMPDEVTLTEQTFIAQMAIEPAWQRRGIGRMLLGCVEDQTRKRGLQYVALAVTEENRAALELYNGAGFITERRVMVKPL